MNGIRESQETQNSARNVKVPIGISKEEKRKLYKRNHYLKNKDKIMEQQRIRRKNNKHKLKEYNEKNKDKIKKVRKRYYDKNKEKRNEASRKWRENNKEKVNEYSNEYGKNRRKTDVSYNITCKFRSSISKTLNKNKIQKTSKTFDILGYTIGMLIKRLKKTLTVLNKRTGIKYTWEHFLKGELHIDHIIPISKFNYKTTDSDDFKRCWALENLQLLPAVENLIKNDKCDNFQTSMFNFID